MITAGTHTCVLNFTTTENNEDIFNTPAVNEWLVKNFPNYKIQGIDAYISILANQEYSGTIEFNNNSNKMVLIENLVYDAMSPSTIRSIKASLPIEGTLIIETV